MYRTTAYVGHFNARFERNVKLYMACAALIGFSAFGIYSVLFNLYLLRMDYDVGLIGHFNAVGLLSFGLFSPIAGNWARRAGYRRTLARGMFLMIMGYLLAVPLSAFAGADKTAVATRTDTAPVVDGHLSDRCWDLAVPTTDFVLLDPVEGAPAANQTVVKILYTADQLYIGLFMADSNAENIDARVVPRDGRFAPRDLIGILLDTQHDHRNAYGFYINPYGIQHDFQMTDDGAKGYRGNNKGWDGVWRAEAAVLDSGWSAEVAIAFSTLAFAAGDDMVWGFNLERLAITGRERSHWAAIYQEDGSVLRVSKAGHLVGLRGIDPGLRLELLPYAASGVDRTHADWRGETADAGLDVKYGVAANATLDITVNPDFAQIEADEEEINLSRFPLLLKERRPFFVENADFLGKHGLFYSRRIADPDFGAARSASGALELKPSASLTIEGSWSSVWEYLPGGAFDERKTIWRGRATYFATKRLFLRGFAQDAGYLNERDINLLASYEIAPKSRVYLAYNLGDTAAERAEKLRFKVAYLLSY